MVRSKRRTRKSRRVHKRSRRTRRTRRVGRSPKGWSKLSPNTRQRTQMLKKCGKKCFLGKKKSFPICAKNTCRINRKGIESAYIRARQWRKKHPSYNKIARTAKRMLRH